MIIKSGVLRKERPPKHHTDEDPQERSLKQPKETQQQHVHDDQEKDNDDDKDKKVISTTTTISQQQQQQQGNPANEPHQSENIESQRSQQPQQPQQPQQSQQPHQSQQPQQPQQSQQSQQSQQPQQPQQSQQPQQPQQPQQSQQPQQPQQSQQSQQPQQPHQSQQPQQPQHPQQPHQSQQPQHSQHPQQPQQFHQAQQSHPPPINQQPPMNQQQQKTQVQLHSQPIPQLPMSYMQHPQYSNNAGLVKMEQMGEFQNHPSSSYHGSSSSFVKSENPSMPQMMHAAPFNAPPMLSHSKSMTPVMYGHQPVVPYSTVPVTYPSFQPNSMQVQPMLPVDQHPSIDRDVIVQEEGHEFVLFYSPKLKEKSALDISLRMNIEHDSPVCAVAIDEKGSMLATGSNHCFDIYNIKNGETIHHFEGSNFKNDCYVRSVAFSPNGDWVAASIESDSVSVWSISSGEKVCDIDTSSSIVYALVFTKDSSTLLIGTSLGNILVFEVASKRLLATLNDSTESLKHGITSLSLNPSSNSVAAGSMDCSVKLWDLSSLSVLSSFKGHEDSVYCVAFSPDGKTIASGSFDKTIKLWDVDSGPQSYNVLEGHRDFVLSLAFSQDGHFLLSGSKDRSVHFWDHRSLVLHTMLQGHKNAVTSVACHSPQKLFATGSGDFRSRVWWINGGLPS